MTDVSIDDLPESLRGRIPQRVDLLARDVDAAAKAKVMAAGFAAEVFG
jgi:hypothetical protein